MPEQLGRVGIVVRTKNRPILLRRALTDITAQDYTAWHVHVVNDGGDVGDVDRVIDAMPGGVRLQIHVTHNEMSLGRSRAANQGIESAESEYIVLHDDDDLWDEAFLSRTVSWLDDRPQDVGVVVRTDIVYEEESASGAFVEIDRSPFWASLREIRYTDLLEINRIVPIAFLYRRQLHETVGTYREDLHAAEDWDFYLRTAIGHHIGFIDGPPLAFWMHRMGVDGDLGNSMYALSEEHRRYDKIVRDDALRAYAAEHGQGLPLFLAAFLREEVAQIVRDELTRQLDSRPSDLQRIARRVRALPWLRRRRSHNADRDSV